MKINNYIIFIILIIVFLLAQKEYYIYLYNKYLKEITVNLSYNPTGLNMFLYSSENSPYDIDYLQHGLPGLEKFLERFHVEKILCINYGLTNNEKKIYYENNVEPFFNKINKETYQLNIKKSIQDQINEVQKAEAIFIGDGNTFLLNKNLHDNQLIDVLREKILNGTPLVGVGSGCNIVSPTLQTSFDLPIVWTNSPNALNLIPFQICTHQNKKDQIKEYIYLNKNKNVLCINEGQILHITGKNGELISLTNENMIHYYLNKNNQVIEKVLDKNKDLSFLF